MKASVIAISVLFVVSVSFLIFSDIFSPVIDKSDSIRGMDSNGAMMFAENEPYNTFIYDVEENVVKNVYTVSNRSANTFYTVTAVAANTQYVYFSRNMHEAGSLTYSGFEICSLTKETGLVKVLYKHNFIAANVINPNIGVSNITLDDVNIYLTTINKDKTTITAYVLGLGEEPSITKVAETEGSNFVSATYNDDVLYGITDNGKLVYTSGSDVLDVRASSGSIMVDVFSGKDGVFACERDRIYKVKDGVAIVQPDEKIDIPFIVKLQMKQPYIIFAIILVAAVSAFLLIASMFFFRSKCLAAKLTSVTMLLLVAMMGTVCYATLVVNKSMYIGTKYSEALHINGVKVQVFDGKPSTVGVQNVPPIADIIKLSDIMIILSSSIYPSGVPCSDIYSNDMLDVIKSSISSNSPQTALIAGNLGTNVVCAYPIVGNETYVMLTRLPADDLYQYLERVLLYTVMIGAISILVALTFIWCVIKGAFRPLKRITKNVNNIIYGLPIDKNVRVSKDEIGELWGNITEMNVAQNIHQYETESSIASYKRFVPEGLAAIMQRASVTEVTLGDIAEIKGITAILSVSNREDIRKVTDNHSFMSFINTSFEHINRSVKANDGVILSSDFNLTGIHIMLSESKSVNFAEKLFDYNDTDTGVSANFCLMLHRTTFLFGIAGAEDRAFPFLSSSELDFLGSYSDKFASMAVRIVATEEFMERHKKDCKYRYIGFLSTPEGHSYKMYEILNTLSEKASSFVLSYDVQLQEALGLFYKKDFYLARNAFSAVLKQNPTDGVARHYLFICEQCFNADNTDDVKFSIFL